MPNASTPSNALEATLERQLREAHGPLLTGHALRAALGFPSMDAMRQAIARRRMPVPVFPLAHRRGKYALTQDVAHWLAAQRLAVEEAVEAGNGTAVGSPEDEPAGIGNSAAIGSDEARAPAPPRVRRTAAPASKTNGTRRHKGGSGSHER